MAFNVAIIGDFSARALTGRLEPSADLAARAPIRFDIDVAEDVIARFATELTLPLGEDGAGVAVPLDGLEAMHPDALVERVPVFAELLSIRRALRAGTGGDAALRALTERGLAVPPLPGPPAARVGRLGAGQTLSDFAALIGAPAGGVAAMPLDDLIARVVAPHIQAAPDPNAGALLTAIDAALSSAMGLILHHPDFQALEAAWRGLDLLARRVACDGGLTLSLYDVAAEELAADLAGGEGLPGVFQMLSDGRAVAEPYRAILCPMRFAPTPPHAELLARLAVLGAALGAPVIAGMEDWALDDGAGHPAAETAWAALRALPEAAYLGLVAPGFLLRHPYGARTDPIDAFAYEEFTAERGVGTMLWANPAIAAAVLLCQNRGPGGALEVPDMPYHVVTDRHGDQVALPTTARSMTEAQVATARAHGIMPLLGARGSDALRLGGFYAVTGGPLAGDWQASPRPTAAPPAQGLLLRQDIPREDLAKMRPAQKRVVPAGPEVIDPDLARLLDGT